MTRRQTLLSRAAPVALGLASIGLLASGAVGDPATSRAVSWRTDDSIAVGEAQIAVATGWTELEDDAPRP